MKKNQGEEREKRQGEGKKVKEKGKNAKKEGKSANGAKGLKSAKEPK